MADGFYKQQQPLGQQNKMLRGIRSHTDPDIRASKQFLSPITNKPDSQRKRVFTQNFKKSPFIHNRFTLYRSISPKSANNIIVTQQQQPKKPSFKLPKIVTQTLKDQQMDDVSVKVVKMKKFFYDPYGCSKSSKLDKVKIRKKIMGVGRENQMILEHFALKNRKKQVFEQATNEQEEKYKIKIYGC